MPAFSDRQLRMLHYAVSTIANIGCEPERVFVLDPPPTLAEFCTIQKQLERALTPPTLPALPYEVVITTRDGEHEYSNDVCVLVWDGQDKDEIADAIAAHESGTPAYCADPETRHKYEAPGDYRWHWAHCSYMPIPVEQYSHSRSYNPTSKMIRWTRMVTQGEVNYDPAEIYGPATFVNVLVKLDGKLSLKRVYVSVLVPEEDRYTRAEYYVRTQTKDCYKTGNFVTAMAADPFSYQQYLRRTAKQKAAIVGDILVAETSA